MMRRVCRSAVRTWYSVLGNQYAVHSGLALLATMILAGPLYADPVATAAHATKPAADMPTLLFVFLLATFIGLGVITRVSRLLHTPLMSLTNAISAIAVVGAIAVAGHEHVTKSGSQALALNILGAIALFASMTNIVSGFLLTDRMVKMFKSQEGAK